MEWIGDYVDYMWHSGAGGVFLLALSAFFALAIALGVLTYVAKAITAAASAFAAGWRKG